MEKVKLYCHKMDCKVVTTGFNVSNWSVCSTCHSEVSEGLKKNIEDRNNKSMERELELDDILGLADDYFDGT